MSESIQWNVHKKKGDGDVITLPDAIYLYLAENSYMTRSVHSVHEVKSFSAPLLREFNED